MKITNVQELYINKKLVDQTPILNEKTIPAKAISKHQLDKDWYGVLKIHKGSINFEWLSKDGEILNTLSLKENDEVFIPSEVPHRLNIIGQVELQISFYK